MIWQPNQLEFVSCNLCGTNETWDVITRNDGLRAVECKSCGLCYINPRPKQEFVHNFYDENYFSKSNKSTGTFAKTPVYGFMNYFSNENVRALIRVAKERFGIATKYVDFTGKMCLEIGCATGEFCHQLKKRGVRCSGIDISRSAIMHAKSRYPDLYFLEGDVGVLNKEELFDVIFAFDVIEHLVDPKAFFTDVADHIRPQGLLFLTTPNYNCVKEIGAERWLGFQMSFEHLYFFSPEILFKYAEATNFSVIDWFTGGGKGIVRRQNDSVRNILRNISRKLHISKIYRTLRDFLTESQIGYRKGGSFHNLFMIFKRN